MVETPIILNDKKVGIIVSLKVIEGSLLNNFQIQEVRFEKTELPQESKSLIRNVIDGIYTVPGSPRLQQIWDFREQVETPSTLVLKSVLFKPKDLCIACSGTGKFQASRHKATAKCPICKGRGYVKNIWTNEEDTNNGNNSTTVVDERPESNRPISS